MPPLINLQKINKKHGHQQLYQDLSLSINKKDRIGVIGPNGSGKSTLLKILAGEDEIDGGEITKSSGLSISYACQNFLFNETKSVSELLEEIQANPKVEAILDLFRFKSLDLPVKQLSGGQKKKLQLAVSLAKDCDLLLLDEPSNHLDFDSIVTLEKLLAGHNAAQVLISHDRWLLQTYAKSILEINPIFVSGCFMAEHSYEGFTDARTNYLIAEDNRLAGLKSKAKVEQDWLRQGAKARSTKSKHRTETAKDLINSLKDNNRRRQTSQSKIEFTASGRQTKELLEFNSVSKSFNETPILDNLSIKITSGLKLGVMGPNGSGKSTFLNLILDEIQPNSGSIRRAPHLNISYFSQVAKEIDPACPLQRVLVEDGDSVVFQGRSLHIASWASRFQFNPKSLSQPYGSLSGGERAKARIAKLVLESPDILLLDEPTNDLDIPTLEILEESLLSFEGALVLVSHDRYLLNTVCNTFLGLLGGGQTQKYASYEQWLEDRNNKLSGKKDPERKPALNQETKTLDKKNKLSYQDQREYNQLENKILKAEAEYEKLNALLTNGETQEIQEICEKLAIAQETITHLYARWEELEKIISK